MENTAPIRPQVLFPWRADMYIYLGIVGHALIESGQKTRAMEAFAELNGLDRGEFLTVAEKYVDWKIDQPPIQHCVEDSKDAFTALASAMRNR